MNMEDEREKLLAALIRDATSLKLISNMGWELESNELGDYFRHQSGLVQPFPFWVTELMNKSATVAAEYTKHDIQRAIGIG